jgi:hypothetical protein
MPRILAAALAGVLLLTGCTAKPAPTPTASPMLTPTPAAAQALTAMPEQATTVVDGGTAADLALATSRALYQHAPAVVVAGVDDGAGQNEAIPTARDLGVPLLLSPNDPAGATVLRAELDRLGTKTIVTVGEAAARWARPDQPIGTAPASPAAAPTATPATLPYEIVERPGDGPMPTVVKAAPLTDLLVLALDKPVSRAAVATAQAAGARVVTMANPDPRVADDVIKALSGQSTDRVLAVGGDFGPAERLRRRIDVAATGVLLPGGGQVLFPGRRMVALYGHPGDSILGSLGEQPLAAAITRARKVADAYRPLVGGEPVVPTFEIITTIASASAGADGDYSLESSIDKIKPWVDAAREAGMYVMLDLQPGRTDFLTQAKRYEPLLKQPHVGLALDPEWRLGPNERHMVQIGSVSAAEVNTVVTWLAELTRANKLPQKLLMLHQFRLDMITERSTVDTSHDELRILIHADGFGTPGQKFNTWRAMHLNPPANVAWGWKNFYDEDRPTFTPAQTVAVNPSPVFVSYQ